MFICELAHNGVLVDTASQDGSTRALWSERDGFCNGILWMPAWTVERTHKPFSEAAEEVALESREIRRRGQAARSLAALLMNCEMRGARANFAAAGGNSVRAGERFCGLEKKKIPVESTIDVAFLAITALAGRQASD